MGWAGQIRERIDELRKPSAALAAIRLVLAKSSISVHGTAFYRKREAEPPLWLTANNAR